MTAYPPPGSSDNDVPSGQIKAEAPRDTESEPAVASFPYRPTPPLLLQRPLHTPSPPIHNPCRCREKSPRRVLSGAHGLRRYPHGRGHQQGLESWLHPRKSEAMLWPNPASIIRTDRRTNETRGRQWMSVRESRYVISIFFLLLFLHSRDAGNTYQQNFDFF
jgi:hypothetical protein